MSMPDPIPYELSTDHVNKLMTTSNTVILSFNNMMVQIGQEKYLEVKCMELNEGKN